MSELQAFLENAKAWPFQEAKALLKRVGQKVPAKGYVLFETGYGPSGLPYIHGAPRVFNPVRLADSFVCLF